MGNDRPRPADGDGPVRRITAFHRGRGLIRRMLGRSPQEEHRTATSLELLFDLCFVVAVAQCGAALGHALAEGDTGWGVVRYAAVFFGVWWAWMNFTWFASAYDTDDVPFRVLTLVQMAGAQVYAAGVQRAFEDNDWRVTFAGYATMRLAQAVQWLRAAAAASGAERRSCAEHAAGLVACQLGWLLQATVAPQARGWVFLAMVVCELTVPAWAHRHAPLPWHPHHIAERYGAFTIIVLGETVTAGTTAFRGTFDTGTRAAALLPDGVGGLTLIFAAWWTYFTDPTPEYLKSKGQRTPWLWGYGHFLIFATAAAIGAGLETVVEQSVGEAGITTMAANAAVTVPAGLFFFSTWLLHTRPHKRDLAEHAVLPAGAVLIIACTLAGSAAILLAGLAASLTVAVGELLSTRADEHVRGE
jgi:low temperature requirement protein LtrA